MPRRPRERRDRAPRTAGVRLLTDIRPLQVSAEYRRLWTGNTVAQLGQQMTAVTIAIQVYALTHSTFAVGLVGGFALVPMVALGLYGGSFSDALDRRQVALVSSLCLWALSLVLVLQAAIGLGSVALLYAVVALQAGAFAVNNPAASAIVPRLVPAELLPAAGALAMASFNVGFTVGPMLGGLVIGWSGYTAAYAVDAVTFTAALYALARLPAMPPLATDRPTTPPGLRSVVEGLRFLRTARNLQMTFVIDMCAMVLAQMRALFPAVASAFYGGGVRTVGLLQAAPAIGSLAAFTVSGWITKVNRHGLAIAVSVIAYGLFVAGFGFTTALWMGMGFLALSGAADMVSAAYRSTMLQVAAPDHLRGRLQGVFTVVVAGGPRLGDVAAGSVASTTSLRFAIVAGGLACVVGVVVACGWRRGFLAYDARHPTP